MTTTEMMLRPLLMLMPFQGMSLMQSPPMLYKTADKKTHRVPILWVRLCPASHSMLRKKTPPDRSGQRAF